MTPFELYHLHHSGAWHCGSAYQSGRVNKAMGMCFNVLTLPN